MAIWRMGFACWIPKVTNTQSEYEYLPIVHRNNGNANEPQCYVVRKYLVFLTEGV